jgi:cobalamin biosynthesis Mg chelatase CobN
MDLKSRLSSVVCLTPMIYKKRVLTQERMTIMANENTSNQQQVAADGNTNNAEQQDWQATSSSEARKSNRNSGKGNNKPRIGGTAVQGAKSTLPKQMPTTSDPNEQQMASYSRTMRRRVEKMGTTSTDRRMQNVQEKRRKRVERNKQKMEEQRAAIRKSMPGGGKITLGKRNTFFLIGVIVLLVLIIAIFVLIRSHAIG